MEEINESNYVDMSLDDVIRDMRAKKACQEMESPENNSPLLRKSNYCTSRPFQSRIPSRSNYVNHLAKKRLLQARKTLDLRHRLISIRASKEGLDLRWKLVANMIAKLRQQSKGPMMRPRSKTYHPRNPFHKLPSNNHIVQGGAVTQPRVSRSTLSQIERLVGRLPSWMKPKVAAPTLPVQQMLSEPQLGYQCQQQKFPSVCGQVRTVPVLQYSQNGHHQHVHCNSIHPRCMPMNGVVKQYAVDPSSCHNPPFIVDSYPDQMPPLAYEPPPPVKQPFKTVAERLEYAGNRNAVDDRIEFTILTEPEDAQERVRVRMTLNERFQKKE